MNRTNLLQTLSNSYKSDFLGYGNPNGDILIIGKECAFEPETVDEFYEELNQLTYYNNADSWDKFCKKPHDSSLISDWKHVKRSDWEKEFSPRFAFRGQCCTIGGTTGTSTTWYRYQKLIDLFLGTKKTKEDLLDFQDYCFITELNGLPMKKSRPSKDVKRSIENRVNGLLKEPFFQSFPLVIAACKGYINRYHIDLKALFPNAKIIITNQLSILPHKGYLEKLADLMMGDEPFIIL